MAAVVTIVLMVWLGLNAAFAAVRHYVTANFVAEDKPNFAGYPRLVN